jgi:hypothetical protein
VSFDQGPMDPLFGVKGIEAKEKLAEMEARADRYYQLRGDDEPPPRGPIRRSLQRVRAKLRKRRAD